MVTETHAPHVSALADLIRDELKTRGWSSRQLSRQSGVSQPVISRVINDPTHSPNLATLASLARAIGQPLIALIEASGFDPGAISHDAEQAQPAER